MRCLFCKRLLKSSKSIERGFGLVCGKKNNMIKITKRIKYKNLFEVEKNEKDN